MRRATVADSAAIADIVNHPSIRPYLGDGGEGGDIDPEPLIENELNVLLFDEGGGQFFEWKGPGVFEAHSFYLVRGKEALDRGREAIRRMIEDHGAELIWRATPLGNRPARWFNRQLGFHSRGEITLPIHGECELFERRV